MVLNLEENVSGWCLKQERMDPEIRNSVNDEDMKLDGDGDSLNYDDLLPRDPFGMGVSINLPNDLTIDFNISLPIDPFGMDVSIETKFSPVGDWIKDYGLQNSQKDDERAFKDELKDDGEFVAEVNFIWAAAEEENRNIVGEMKGRSGLKSLSGEMKDSMLVGCEKWHDDDRKSFDFEEDGSQVDAILFSLSHLGIKELLTVECICKRLKDAVQDNPPLWRNIVIDHPFCDSITDSDLLQLTNRAQGKLHSLSLVRCMRITSSGLRHVLEANAQLTKLSVAGCMKLNTESVYESIKIFNSSARPGIKQLRIGNLLGLTEQLFKDFKLLLGDHGKKESEKHKPRYYCDGEVYLTLEDERVIDVEICPRCQRPRQVYDCTSENCIAKMNSTKPCKACICCIPRCVCCGCCFEDKAFEETFLLEPLCLNCFKRIISSSRTSFYDHQIRLTFSPRLNASS